MNSALALFKALSDDARLRILNALGEKDMYVELLAERLQLSAPTVSFHMKKLQAAGLVDTRREQYYTMYSLRRDVFGLSLGELVFRDSAAGAEAVREEQYRRRVIRAFMPDGTCETLPAQVKKRLIVFREIFSRFEPGRTYTEKEVNEIIAPLHADFCTVRRAFVGMGWMSRDKGVYTVHTDVDFDDASGIDD
jgi:biotin operon repressor